ncbi:phage tail protein [Thalassolituus hydrocarboniclasticus]|uniref:Tail fiber protein n=1 Tax=Thalassolituus hydrocarboniclasticus TaxID=2742796 RepID=A0ABY6AAB1_9GAMM|nr:tail fiber protein [Thalassolituus hydrocarboniclasticus]UXD86830.1 tail fiber protein [Thalassolituus hydrocarboniclasticus]
MEGTIATVTQFGANWAPRTWSICAGQLLAISSNTSLFSIIGTMYGGDGRTTFALPDLRGRCALGTGAGPGLTPRAAGQHFGTETVTLTSLNLPSHNHTVIVQSAGHVAVPVNTETGEADEASPGAGVLTNSGGDAYASAPTANAMYSGSPIPVEGLQVETGLMGGNQSFNNMQPSLAISYIICTQGIFPSRN